MICELSRDTHKGWDIFYDPRSWNPGGCWSATSPSYAPDCDEDGFFAGPDTYVTGKTRDDVVAQIDDLLEDEA